MDGCDAYAKNVGAVLMQDETSSTFTCKKLCDMILGKSSYKKEMIVILHAVDTRSASISRWITIT